MEKIAHSNIERTARKPTGWFKGLFSEFGIVGNRYIDADGKEAWSLRTHCNDGRGKEGNYWLQGDVFFRVVEQSDLLKDAGTGTEPAPLSEALDPNERAAMLEAIAYWTAHPERKIG